MKEAFSLSERVEKLTYAIEYSINNSFANYKVKEIYEDEERVTVEAFSDMAADLAKRHNATAVVKGVRSVKDYEYERAQAEYNRLLGEGLETVLFFSKPELSALSSSAVRTLQHFGRDVSEFLPQKKQGETTI